MTIAIEQSTYVITASFTDETGSAVVPNSVTWTLLNGDGQIVNSRSEVSVTPASSIVIVLSGDDLDLDDGETRKIRIDAVYDSTNGTNLPLKDSETFAIEAV